jgi:hypothetical protein
MGCDWEGVTGSKKYASPRLAA